MVGWIASRRCSPIGVDIGSRSVKLLQFDAVAAGFGPRPAGTCRRTGRQRRPPGRAQVVEAIRHARQGPRISAAARPFCAWGRAACSCRTSAWPRPRATNLTKIVHFEAAGRLPFASEEAEIRYLEADDVRKATRCAAKSSCWPATGRRSIGCSSLAEAGRPAARGHRRRAGGHAPLLQPAVSPRRRPAAEDHAGQRRRLEHRGGHRPRRRHDVRQVHRRRRTALRRGRRPAPENEPGRRRGPATPQRRPPRRPTRSRDRPQHRRSRSAPCSTDWPTSCRCACATTASRSAANPWSQIVLGGGEATTVAGRVARHAAGPALRSGRSPAAVRANGPHGPGRAMGRRRRTGPARTELRSPSVV